MNRIRDNDRLSLWRSVMHLSGQQVFHFTWNLRVRILGGIIPVSQRLQDQVREEASQP